MEIGKTVRDSNTRKLYFIVSPNYRWGEGEATFAKIKDQGSQSGLHKLNLCRGTAFWWQNVHDNRTNNILNESKRNHIESSLWAHKQLLYRKQMILLNLLLSLQMRRYFCPTLPDRCCFDKMCMGSWIPDSALCGGLKITITLLMDSPLCLCCGINAHLHPSTPGQPSPQTGGERRAGWLQWGGRSKYTVVTTHIGCCQNLGTHRWIKDKIRIFNLFKK